MMETDWPIIFLAKLIAARRLIFVAHWLSGGREYIVLLCYRRCRLSKTKKAVEN